MSVFQTTSRARWTVDRKADLILAVRDGRVSLEEAMALHALSPEEFAQWESDFDRGGKNWMKVSRQDIRERRVRERLAGAPEAV